MPGPEVEPSSADAGSSVSAPRTKAPRVAIILGAVGRTLITTGVVVFLFVAYQLWGTGFQERQSQNELSNELDQYLSTAALNIASITDPIDVPVAVTTTTVHEQSPTTSTTTPSATTPPTTTSTLPGGYDPDVLALFFPENGDALARLEVPDIGVDKVVVRGVDVPDLRKGPGHYPSTVLPGNEGNSAIAGHRTTYGAPFNRIDELQPGNEITLTGIQGEFTYRVLDPAIAFAGYEDQIDGFGPGYIVVKPSATWVLDDFGDNRLTLTACHPKLSARQRIIVAAELVGDAVHIPTWVEQYAAAARQQLGSPIADLGAADVTTTITTTTIGEDLPQPTFTPIDVPISAVRAPVAGDLDRGLNGERDAIPAAVLWMFGAVVFWVGSGYLGRRYMTQLSGRIIVRVHGLVPAAVFMWYSFQMIDRALPAY